ncbi:MAG: TlpA family protein disulfide reductase [Planctomycetaceae bacterium]|jgi:hypothetical protein|nr:TlpA family protein disulfide reductase [Planctomycetaceae bacterium]
MMKKISPFLFFVLCTLPLCSVFGQDSKSAHREAAAKTRPIQRDIDIDLIKEEEIPLCELVISDDARQMRLLSPQKVVLRHFADTDGDSARQVDQWSYYQNGVEVYREIDTTGDGKQDQFRWLNSAGTRWGVDQTGDGVINQWKEISAEEVSREIVFALATQDVQRFANVTLKEDELKNLALGASLNSTVAKKVAALKTGFAQAAAAVGLSKEVEWHQLSAVMPGVVPQGEQGNKQDIHVYENAAVTISDGGTVRQIMLGTLVKIGDNNWRVLDLPKNYDESQASFTFIQPVHAQGSTGPTDNEIVALMNQVDALQAQIPNLPVAQRPAKHKEVIALLMEIVKKSATQEERENWIRQIADTILQAVSQNELPDGKEQIAIIFDIVNKPTMQELAAHVRSRQIMVEYCLALASGGDTMKAYTDWLDALEELVTTFPKTEAGLEGMMQLASYKEMLEPTNEESIKWYNRIIELVPGQPQAAKAQGAIRRLTKEGTEVPFRGSTDTTGKTFDIAEYKGKFVLLCFWEAHTASQLSAIKAITDRFEPAGLVPIGLNLDPDEATMRASLRSAPAWRHLYAPNGLDGALATYWGIMTTPSMILYDKDGKVVRASISTVEDLQQVLTERVK